MNDGYHLIQSERDGENKMAETEEKKRSFTDRTGINFKCPGCAGTLRYSIEKGNLLCEQCGGVCNPNSFTDPSASGQAGGTAEIETVEYRCPSCGASLYSTATGTTSFCSFCGSNVILKERLARMRRPDKILPFTMTREECEKIYFDHITKSPLVPDDMINREAASHFRPVYIPFWRLSGSGKGEGTGEYVTETRSGDYRYINTHEVILNEEVEVSNLFYDACSQFDDETAQWLQFRWKEAVPFHPAYLSGLYAEAPDVDSHYFSGLVRSYAEKSVGEAVWNTIGSKQMVATLPENFQKDAELFLMPVWLLASRQGERVVYTAISGRKKDHAIRSDLPVSPKRFTVMTAALAALITLIVILLHNVIMLRPQITAGLSCLTAVLCWNAAGPFLTLVNQRRKDDDPTRNILRGDGKTDISEHLKNIEPKIWQDCRYAIPPKKFLRPGIIVGAILLLYLLFSQNKLRAINSLISDESVIPPLLGIASFVLLLIIMRRSRGMSATDYISIIAQMGLCALLFILKAAAANKPLFYAVGLVSFAITLFVLIRAFMQHNVYVSRRVPFFEDREGDRP